MTKMEMGFEIAGCIIAFITLCVTIYIPEKIKWEQRYAQLMSDYRSYDFAAAVQGVVDFFVKDCGSNIEKIKTAYEDRFTAEVDNENIKPSVRYSTDSVLHYQRRLLNCFYYELNECARSPFVGIRRVRSYFTEKEADILKILYFMNKAVKESSVLFKDIHSDEPVPKPRSSTDMNTAIARIYDSLRRRKK